MMDSGFSKRELLIFLYKYRIRLALAFILPFALALAASFIPVPRYTATSVLVVRMGPEFVYQPEASAPNNPIPLSDPQIFKSEAAILASKDLHRRVVYILGPEELFPELFQPQSMRGVMEWLGLEAPLPEESEAQRLTRAVELFGTRFSLLLEKESAVIRLSFEHKDSELASLVLDRLLQLYFEKRKQLYLQPRSELAQSEVAEVRAQVIKTSRAIEQFKRAHNIYSLEDQRAALLKRREELEHQSVSIVSPVLDRRIAEYNRQLETLDSQEQELGILKKEAEIAANAYSLYSSKLDDAKAYDNLQRERQNSVRIIQPPTVGAEPKRLQPIILLGGFFFSLMMVLATAALTEFSRRGFLAPEQIERALGLPVLAVIPLRRRI